MPKHKKPQPEELDKQLLNTMSDDAISGRSGSSIDPLLQRTDGLLSARNRQIDRDRIAHYTRGSDKKTGPRISRRGTIAASVVTGLALGGGYTLGRMAPDEDYVPPTREEVQGSPPTTVTTVPQYLLEQYGENAKPDTTLPPKGDIDDERDLGAPDLDLPLYPAEDIIVPESENPNLELRPPSSPPNTSN